MYAPASNRHCCCATNASNSSLVITLFTPGGLETRLVLEADLLGARDGVSASSSSLVITLFTPGGVETRLVLELALLGASDGVLVRGAGCGGFLNTVRGAGTGRARNSMLLAK